MREWFQAVSVYQNLKAWSPHDRRVVRRPGAPRSGLPSLARAFTRLLWPAVRRYRRHRIRAT